MGGSEAQATIAPDQVLERLLRNRHSCRGFLPTPVPRVTIRRILDLAQRTASWCNAQPWQVTVTSGAATERFRAALLAHAAASPPAPDIPFPRDYLGVYRERRRACGFQLYDSVGVARGDRAASAEQTLENFRLFGAPHVAIVTSDEALGAYGAVDCGAYVATFMLAAESLGVASIAQAALATFAPFVRAHFGIPEGRTMVCGISFGFRDPDHPANGFRTARAEIDEAVSWADD
jgi:nitroreductase